MRKFLFFTILLTCFSAFAEDRFSGYAGIGLANIKSDDKLSVSDNSEYVNDNPDEKKAFVTGELKYKISDVYSLHIGAPQEAAEMYLKAGAEAAFGTSKIDLSAVYKPSEVWQNPYLDYRSKTDETVTGVSFSYENIGGMPFFIDAKYLVHSVDRDTAGEAHPELRRDGTETDIRLGYTVKKRLEIYARFIDDSREGEAESYTANAQGLRLRMPFQPKNVFIAGIEGRQSLYEGRNPYFGITRQDAAAVMFANLIFNNVFGLKDVYVTVAGFYKKNVSNIGYFDHETTGTLVTTGIRF